MLQKEVQSFLDAIDPFKEAYVELRFSFLAIRHEGQYCIQKGNLYLDIGPSPEGKMGIYKTENVLTGCITLEDDIDSLGVFIEKMLSGLLPLETQGTEILFLGEKIAENNSSYEGYHINHHSFHPEGLNKNTRQNVLEIRSKRSPLYSNQTALNWELMASETPYAGLHELSYAYNFGTIDLNESNINIIADQVVAVSKNSKIDDGQATIEILVANNLPKDKATVGYILQQENKVIKRERLNASSLTWKNEANYQSGKISVNVPENSIVQCFASYAGIMQHSWWILDPNKIRNPRRAAYETFDSHLSRIKEIIDDGSTYKKQARDLETAVSGLLWLLGFSVVQIDNMSKTQDAPDIIAVTPKEQYVIVECTVGYLKQDDKLLKLNERAESLKKKLEVTGNVISKVLPIIVTTKSNDNIQPELQQAEKLGVLVVTNEDLRQVLEQQKFDYMQDPDQRFDEMFNQVRTAQKRHKENELQGDPFPRN